MGSKKTDNGPRNSMIGVVEERHSVIPRAYEPQQPTRVIRNQKSQDGRLNAL